MSNELHALNQQNKIAGWAGRSIKSFVIYRRNVLFANTPSGARGGSMIFPLIQNSIENGLDPYHYLTWLLKASNTANLVDLKIIQSLLSWYAPEECRTK